MNTEKIKHYKNLLGWRNKLARLCWNITYLLLFRPFGSSLLMPWRKLILLIFGAKLGKGCNIYSSVRIWAPWNLTMGDDSCMAPEVDCYNVAKISIGDRSTISQKSYLCTASHDISDPFHRLITSPIEIEDQVWVAADAFVGMGVRIGQGAVVGARSAVFKDVKPWTVVGGNPSHVINKRILR